MNLIDRIESLDLKWANRAIYLLACLAILMGFGLIYDCYREAQWLDHQPTISQHIEKYPD